MLGHHFSSPRFIMQDSQIIWCSCFNKFWNCKGELFRVLDPCPCEPLSEDWEYAAFILKKKNSTFHCFLLWSCKPILPSTVPLDNLFPTVLAKMFCEEKPDNRIKFFERMGSLLLSSKHCTEDHKGIEHHDIFILQVLWWRRHNLKTWTSKWAIYRVNFFLDITGGKKFTSCLFDHSLTLLHVAPQAQGYFSS